MSQDHHFLTLAQLTLEQHSSELHGPLIRGFVSTETSTTALHNHGWMTVDAESQIWNLGYGGLAVSYIQIFDCPERANVPNSCAVQESTILFIPWKRLMTHQKEYPVSLHSQTP